MGPAPKEEPTQTPSPPRSQRTLMCLHGVVVAGERRAPGASPKEEGSEGRSTEVQAFGSAVLVRASGLSGWVTAIGKAPTNATPLVSASARCQTGLITFDHVPSQERAAP
jgi:hypothetical protein